MSAKSGYGKIPTNGLRLFYDTGDTETSFKGKPTTNLVPDASNMTGWSNYNNGNDGTFITEFGTVGYKMYNRGSWNGIVKGISLPSTGTYTLSIYLRYLGGASDNNGGVIYTSGGGISDTAAGHGKSVGEWVRFSMTRTYTSTSINFFLISYGGTYGGSYSSWEVTMPQVEAGSLMTPFVDGSRSTTTSLLDIVGVSTLEVMNSPFDGSGNLNFDGTNTYIQVNQDVLSSNSPYTLVTIMRPTDLNSMDNSFPQYNTYPNGFWHHMSSNGTTIAWRHGGTSGTFTGHGMSNNTWGMHSMTYDGTTLKLYSNGILTNSTNSAGSYGNNGTGLARIGMLSQRSSGNDYNYNGVIPVNMVYNRALSQSEMFDIYEHFRPRYSLPAIKDGSTSALAAPSATHLKNLGISADGNYWLQPSGQSAFQAPVKFYLGKAMVCVMKGGNGEGFVPDSAYWENSTLLNENDFTLTNGSASKYQSYNVVPFTEFYFQMGLLDYQTTFSLGSEVSSMLTAQQRPWNDNANRSTPHYGNSLDYRTLEGRDRRYLSTLGTEIYLMGMDLKHQGHYSSSGSSGGRIRVGSILDESTGNTGALTYGAAGSAFGIGVNGGNPLKTGVCGYGGWTESDIIGKNDNWSVWVVF